MQRQDAMVAGRYSHAVRKHPAEGDFRVQSLWGGTVSPAEPNLYLSQHQPAAGDMADAISTRL